MRVEGTETGGGWSRGRGGGAHPGAERNDPDAVPTPKTPPDPVPAPGRAPDAPRPTREAAEPVVPYAMSSRTRAAIASLAEGTAPAQRRPCVGVLSDAEELQKLASYSLGAEFEVVVGSDLDALEAGGPDRRFDLIVADLYTLDHLAEEGRRPLVGAYGDVPLLVLSQEVPAHADLLHDGSLARTYIALPILTPAATLRRLALALISP